MFCDIEMPSDNDSEWWSLHNTGVSCATGEPQAHAGYAPELMFFEQQPQTILDIIFIHVAM